MAAPIFTIMLKESLQFDHVEITNCENEYRPDEHIQMCFYEFGKRKPKSIVYLSSDERDLVVEALKNA